MRKLLGLVLLVLFGCNQTKVTPDVRFECQVRPIVITTNNGTSWTSDMVQRRLDVVNATYEKANICFTFGEIEFLERPDLYDADTQDKIKELYRLAKEWCDTKGELAVHFVNVLGSNGAYYGGLSNYPSNLLGSIYQHGVLISTQSYTNVVAHELGHAFNLPHPWEDDLVISDTPSNNPKDCGTVEQYCNVMSYCDGKSINPECAGIALSVQQCSRARNWASFYPRTLVTTAVGGTFTPSALPVYTNSIEPAYSGVKHER